jgi:glutathione peroxidase
MVTDWKRSTLVGALLTLGIVASSSARACPPLLNHSFPALQDGKPMSLCQYAGKVILVVNTASFCGYTSQYDGLEKLYARLKDKGLVVLGFPSNDFGEQEPGSNKEIADFCRLTYGVEFPMLAKTTVSGRERQSLLPEAGRSHRQQAALEFPQIPDQSRCLAGRCLHQLDQAG